MSKIAEELPSARLTQRCEMLAIQFKWPGARRGLGPELSFAHYADLELATGHPIAKALSQRRTEICC